VALPGEERPVGWLALGTPLSGGVYTPKDLDFLDSLSDQSSVAISRVQTVVDLERRVQEMNALTRVSQGVNVTLTFDDILELIFAQTSQIIPASLFHITLYSKAANYFYYAFRVDDNERLLKTNHAPAWDSRDHRKDSILTQTTCANVKETSPSARCLCLIVPLNSVRNHGIVECRQR
jgi:hypothetical protein